MAGDTDAEQKTYRRSLGLIGLGAFSALGYSALLWLSWQFADKVPHDERPTVWMLALFGSLFAAYWCALWLAVRLPPTRWFIGGIFAAACLFRGILLPSTPMHEIDIYRYIWDGAVLADGVSPYRYSPQLVQNAVNAGGSADVTLQHLVELQARSESLGYSLNQIHYGQYPSPYPMVSQAVFALSAGLTPDSASRQTRLVIMKGLLVSMDLATLAVVILLLHSVGMHPGWSLAYGWCPLMMKEIANGGHLDSIAIFLTTLAVWMLVKAWQATSLRRVWVAATGLALALAIGAKLYPVVLMPLFTAVWLRRQGWMSAAVGVATTVLISTVLLYPLLGPTQHSPPVMQTDLTVTQPDETGQLNALDQLQPPGSQLQNVEADEGIQAFFKHWEMNDLVFMFVLENLRQQGEIAPERRPWFVFTSDEWSRAVVTRWAAFKQKRGGTDQAEQLAQSLTPAALKAASFSLARLLTGGVFALIACLLAWFAAGKNEPKAWCRAAMLTLAWFWLTCPTQNPWYWCWALPFLPFARYRTWHMVAAITMLYYLRFWFTAHYPDPPTLGTPYDGTYFFYFVVAWVEFLPVLLALLVESIWARKKTTIDKMS